MTLKRSLQYSHITMVVVAIILMFSVAAMCGIGVHSAMQIGSQPGFTSEADSLLCFHLTDMLLSEIVQEQAEDYSEVEKLIDDSAAYARVISGDQVIYVYGTPEDKDQKMQESGLYVLEYAEDSSNEVHCVSGYRHLYCERKRINNEEFTFIFSCTVTPDITAQIRLYLILSAAGLIALIGITSGFMLRFFTKRVLRKIKQAMDCLVDGATKLGNGNYDYRLAYTEEDEFKQVCDTFDRMAEKLQRVEQEKDRQEVKRRELFIGITHDLKSPLTSIRAYAEGMLDGVADTEEIRTKYLKIIQSKAEEIERLLDQLMLYSKLELNAVKVELKAVCLEDLFSSFLNENGDIFAAQGLEITTSSDPEIMIYTDYMQFQRIISNICENSLKYKNREHGHLWISAVRNNGKVQILFADDGPGVEEQDVSRLFEVFYRTDKSRSRMLPGNGLGLAVVHHIVSRMYGEISAFLNEYGGLSIMVMLPEAEESADHAEDTDCRG